MSISIWWNVKQDGILNHWDILIKFKAHSQKKKYFQTNKEKKVGKFFIKYWTTQEKEADFFFSMVLNMKANNKIWIVAIIHIFSH